MTVSGGDLVIQILDQQGQGAVQVYASNTISLDYFPGDVPASVTLTDDGQGGVEVFAVDAACYAAGTLIRTDRGEIEVESLAIGDMAQTASGRAHRIVWIGHRHVDCRRHPKAVDVWPVRIKPGAFGTGVPARELFLSPDHAVFIDEVLIPIRYLINGATIVQEPRDAVTYWHVELARHDVILAEGLPCESYLDTGNRSAFANGGSAVQLHPDFALRIWEKEACAPLVRDGAELEAARSYLLDRAEGLGHALTHDPALHVLVHGRLLRAVVAGRRHRFILPPDAGTVRLVSRSAIPAHVRDDSTDHRRLGVAVSDIRLNGQEIGLTDARLTSGWHDHEAESDGSGWRWTNGDAGLAVPSGRVLEIEVAMTERYWLDRAATPVSKQAAV